MFVAGFIGSPAMNMAQATLITDTDGTLLLRVGDYRWPLPPGQLGRRPALHQLVGRELIVGLRPHALAISDGVEGTGARIGVTAVTVESLGSEKNVLFLPPFEVPEAVADPSTQAETELAAMWTANIDPLADVTTGQHIALRLDLDRAYFFDAESGLAIPANDAPGAAAKDGPKVLSAQSA